MATKSSPAPQASGKKKSKPSAAKAQVNGVHSDASTVADASKDANAEGGFVKEIERRIRNTNKKLSGMAKVISIVSEHPNTSVDDLVSQNIINKDQREQYLKKPELEKQVAQLQEQRDQLVKVEEDLKRQFETEKQELEAKQEKEIEAARADTTRDRTSFLTISKFLCAAAARRHEADDNTPETQAFEGLLLAFYNGNAESVDAIEKLVTGSDDTVLATSGVATTVTYSQVRELSAPYGYGTEAESDAVAADTGAQESVGQAHDAAHTDPTVANAGLTETDDVQESTAEAPAAPADAPETSVVDEGAANAAAAEQWDDSKATITSDGGMGDSWVAVPRDPAEVEGQATGSAAGGQSQSWADEPVAAEPVVVADAATTPNDGFSEVPVRGGRRSGSGEGRGRGRGGYRGDGRGRGGYRGGRGGGYRGRGRGGGDGASRARGD